jgi:hypothetical protein
MGNANLYVAETGDRRFRAYLHEKPFTGFLRSEVISDRGETLKRLGITNFDPINLEGGLPFGLIYDPSSASFYRDMSSGTMLGDIHEFLSWLRDIEGRLSKD